MKILVLTFYFKPDLCAGSFRATALVDALKEELPTGSHIDVVTTMPNRYHNFKAEVGNEEKSENVTIYRIELPKHTSGMLDQSKAFITFFRAVNKYIKEKEYDIVFVTSSRLLTAFLGALIAKKKSSKLYIDIRDIFSDTIGDVFSSKLGFLMKAIFSFVEKWTIQKADKINLVSGGFKDYFAGRYFNKKYSFFTNGIDEEFLSIKPVLKQEKNDKIEVLYAGNIGEGQGLHRIIPALAESLKDKVVFKIIGSGGRLQALQNEIESKKIHNVTLLPPLERTSLLDAYQKCDVLFLHLNDYPAFKKVLPSKLFEYAATGKPIWAGVAGYSAEFIVQQVENAMIFEPCNIEQAIKSFYLLKIENIDRGSFVSRYTRKAISRAMAQDILATAG